MAGQVGSAAATVVRRTAAARAGATAAPAVAAPPAAAASPATGLTSDGPSASAPASTAGSSRRGAGSSLRAARAALGGPQESVRGDDDLHLDSEEDLLRMQVGCIPVWMGVCVCWGFWEGGGGAGAAACTRMAGVQLGCG